ncbi:MAG: TetR/AcrR family transcriptional regulator [Chloroflexi bacterium]|nr:TetR/AcrR family transcriptional regulator [Chloroflexota bacterium]
MCKPLPAPSFARDRLLAAVLDHIQHHGLADFSLRELAAAIGTSHRMLIYHFGSRDGLLVAVVQAVERAQRAFLADLLSDTSLSRAEVMRTMWRRLADPALWPNERLFYELYAQALQGRPGTTGFLDDVVDAWVEPMVDLADRYGLDPDEFRADTRLAVAVVRGLLLDLLATADRAAVDAAFERYVQLYPETAVTSEARTRESTPPRQPGRDPAAAAPAGGSRPAPRRRRSSRR